MLQATSGARLPLARAQPRGGGRAPPRPSAVQWDAATARSACRSQSARRPRRRLGGVVAVRAEQQHGDGAGDRGDDGAGAGAAEGVWPAAPATLRTCVVQFHKPVGLVTSRAHQHGAATVYDFLQEHGGMPAREMEDWHCVGRLDKDTSGLLLLTNDGRLVHHVTNSTAHAEGMSSLPKTYLATCMGILEEARLQALRDGVDLAGGLGMSHPAEVETRAVEGKSCVLQITIREGKNRQIRRMLHAVGSGVMRLQRTRVGALHLEDGTAASGSWRLLTDAQVGAALGYAPRPLGPPARRRPRESTGAEPGGREPPSSVRGGAAGRGGRGGRGRRAAAGGRGAGRGGRSGRSGRGGRAGRGRIARGRAAGK